MSDDNPQNALIALTKDAWARYLELLDGLRPDLFRYCRRLTGNVWDAEDLVQDALQQGFARLGIQTHGIDNPRGYVLRIASNLWVSRQRRDRLARDARQGPAADGVAPHAAPAPDTSTSVRDASATLLQYLAPQERAAVLLKEIFDLSLAETAEVLATTEGAVKAALHRGRERLREVEDTTAPRHPVSRAVIDAFVERYNARDMSGLLALMLDDGAVEMLGAEQQIVRTARTRKRNWFYYNFYSPFDGKPTAARWEVADHRGEPIVLVLSPRDGETKVSSVMRLETDGDRVAKILVYAMCPDTVKEVAAELGRQYGGFALYRLPKEILARLTAAAKEAEEEG